MSQDPKHDHPLIDTYLKRKWSLVSITIKVLAFCLILVLGSYYYWRVVSPETQESLRKTYPTVNKLAGFLETNGLAPSTEEGLLQLEEERKAKREKEAQSKVDLAANQEKPGNRLSTSDPSQKGSNDDRVFDLREHTNVKPESDEQTYLVMGTDEDGNPAPRRVTMAELERMQALEDERVRKIKDRRRDTIKERFVRKIEVDKLMEEGGLVISWKVWDKAYPLTWDHFKNIDYHQEKGRWGAYIRTDLAVSSRNGVWSCFAYMMPEGSWCGPASKTDRGLRHESIHFDITEVYARKLRALILQNWGDDAKISRLVSETRKELSAAQGAYDNDTHHSLDREKQVLWEDRIAKALESSSGMQWTPHPRNLAVKKLRHGYFLLGQVYDLGEPGFDKSPKLAKKWYTVGVHADQTHAMNNLGAMYQRGDIGKGPNLKKAFKLYLRAARAGNNTAQFNVGVAYWRGRGVKQDLEKAVKWFVSSADYNPYSRHALKILESEKDG